MLDRERSILLVTDIQGRLAELMHQRETLYRNAGIMIEGARALDIPIMWIEQYPKGLGPTVPEVARHLEGHSPLAKTSFSSLREPAIRQCFEEKGRHQVILVGIETHVCIYQTACDLISSGYEAHVVSDAVSSRTAGNKALGLGAIERAGGHVTGTEMALFELLGTAGGDAFKTIIGLVK